MGLSPEKTEKKKCGCDTDTPVEQLPPTQQPIAFGPDGEPTLFAGGQTSPAEPGKKSFGAASYVKAKLGGEIATQVQEMRWSLCVGCQEKDVDSGEKLFQRDGPNLAFCGPKHGLIERRDESSHGCGCELNDKVKWKKSTCPRGRWGPGMAFGNGIIPLWFDGVNDETLPKVMDFMAPTSGKTMDMTGIGDTICHVILVQAIQKQYDAAGTGWRVRFATLSQRVEWAKVLLAGTNIEVIPLDDPDIVKGAQRYHSSDQRFIEMDETCKINNWRNRHVYWSERFGVDYKSMMQEWVVHIPKESWEHATEWLTEAKKFGNPVIGLAPYSTGVTRDLPVAQWMQLAAELKSLGYIVFVLDRPESEEETRNRSNDLGCRLYDGSDPANIMAVIDQVDMIVGNDSGLAHLAGFVGTPFLAICGPTSGEIVFSGYPSANWFQMKGDCAACYWFQENGWKPWCSSGCQLLVKADILPFVQQIELIVPLGDSTQII